MVGFGALARDAGLTAGQAVFLTGSIFALPAQVALVDQIGRGAALTPAAIAVALTSIRLTPMTVVLMPYLRGSGLPRVLEYFAAHFIAVTAWVAGLQRLPNLAERVRLPYFLGMCTTLGAGVLLCTGVGYQMAASVPALIAGVLLFLTPIYFVLALIGASLGARADQAAIVLGCIFGPLFFLLAPGLDLMLTGLIAGTLAYGLGRIWDRSTKEPTP